MRIGLNRTTHEYVEYDLPDEIGQRLLDSKNGDYDLIEALSDAGWPDPSGGEVFIEDNSDIHNAAQQD